MKILPNMTEISKAIHTAEGVLKGIAADSKITKSETDYLSEWLSNYTKFKDIMPFSEVFDYLSYIQKSKEIDLHLHEEFIDFCSSFHSESGEIDLYSKDMRVLHGILQGISADSKILKSELNYLQKWLISRSDYYDKWPVKDLNELLSSILEDNRVTKQEERSFLEFAKGFSQHFVSGFESDSSILPDKPFLTSESPTVNSIENIVDNACPIIIHGNSFCFTGQMKAGKRKDIESKLKAAGGINKSSISKELNYLVIGANSNPAWMYSTYGRKIEKVMEYNSSGSNIFILHENRFIEYI